MSESLVLFFTGMSISFLGTLPLGNLNITAMQIAISENTRKALLFSLGVALVEIVYVRLSLKGIDWIMAHQAIFRYMEWAAVIIFAVLGVVSLLAARRQTTEKTMLLNNRMHRFLLGVSMSAVNPAQIPFWFAWSSYLFSTGVLKSSTGQFNVYVTGIAIGTLGGLLLFIFGGRWLVKKLNASQRFLQVLMGLVFLLSAGIQLYKILVR